MSQLSLLLNEELGYLSVGHCVAIAIVSLEGGCRVTSSGTSLLMLSGSSSTINANITIMPSSRFDMFCDENQKEFEQRLRDSVNYEQCKELQRAILV